jgi:hypothetical protein
VVRAHPTVPILPLTEIFCSCLALLLLRFDEPILARKIMQPMRDTERRGIVLERFYDVRHKVDWFDFNALRTHVMMDQTELANICKQLGQHGLIEWESVDTLTGNIPMRGRITASGIDVIEGTAPAPISITLHDHSVRVTSSSNVQIGNANTQTVQLEIKKILTKIEQAGASQSEKQEAKSLLERLSNNALLVSLVGGLFSGGVGSAQ